MSPPREPRPELLVIMPCGTAKIWSKYPDAGPTPAADAYTGAPFVVNRAYAERAGGDWVILSAKYGFLRPADVIPGPYNTTFKRKSSNPIGLAALREQVPRMGLDPYAEVVGLGGKEYRAAIAAAFEGTAPALTLPFAGLPIGKAMKAIKRATTR
ncbi:MAG TPA: hypothetical protein VF838_11945 [Trebonia sp.]